MQKYNYGSKKLVGLQNVEQTTDRPLKDNLKDLKWLKRTILSTSSSAASWASPSTNGATSPGSARTRRGYAGAELLLPHMTVEGRDEGRQAFELVRDYTAIVRETVKIPSSPS